jgi:hypothetical protein
MMVSLSGPFRATSVSTSAGPSTLSVAALRSCPLPAAVRRGKAGAGGRPGGARTAFLAAAAGGTSRRRGAARQLLRAAKEILVRKKSARSSKTLASARRWPTTYAQVKLLVRHRPQAFKQLLNDPLQRVAQPVRAGHRLAGLAESSLTGPRPASMARARRQSDSRLAISARGRRKAAAFPGPLTYRSSSAPRGTEVTMTRQASSARITGDSVGT